MNTNLIILLVLLVIALIIKYNDTLRINYTVYLIVKRGILAPNRTWWNISEILLKDASGVELYRTLKNKYIDFIPANIYGIPILTITNPDYVKQLLDNSPTMFGVGNTKYNMFKSFMKLNVGVSNCPAKNTCPWKPRRLHNESILATDKLHPYADRYHKLIYDYLNKTGVPINFDEASTFAKKMITKIVFNRDEVNDDVFQIFSEANSMKVLIYGAVDIPDNIESAYWKYIKDNLSYPKKYSLVEMAKNIKGITDEEIIHQIPHWMFPVGGAFNTNVPRFLLMMYNHPDKFRKLINEIRTVSDLDNVKEIYKLPYLRKCILELLRVNNPVVTTFRTLLKDYSFDGKNTYEKGTHFLILNNPILREKFFGYPDKFIPERWNKELEKSYYAIMFNQGPQRCPGKELAIVLMQSTIVNIIRLSGVLDGKTELMTKKINTEKIPQMLNPCTINISYRNRTSSK